MDRSSASDRREDSSVWIPPYEPSATSRSPACPQSTLNNAFTSVNSAQQSKNLHFNMTSSPPENDNAKKRFVRNRKSECKDCHANLFAYFFWHAGKLIKESKKKTCVKCRWKASIADASHPLDEETQLRIMEEYLVQYNWWKRSFPMDKSRDHGREQGMFKGEIFLR